MGAYVNILKYMRVKFPDDEVHLWCQDLDAAYRQVPVLPDEHMYTILMIDAGSHLVAPRRQPFWGDW